MKPAALALMGMALLAACEEMPAPAAAPAPDAPAQAAPAPATGQVPGPNAVPLDRAVSLFLDVCAGSLPRFDGAEARMAANGVDVPSPSGSTVRYSGTENLSFNVDRDGAYSCSMVFGTADDPSGLPAALATINPTQVVDGNLATLYTGGGSQNLVLVEGVRPGQAGQTLVTLRMYYTLP